MNWDDDIDFMAGRKSGPKQGRRAGMSASSTQSPQEISLEAENSIDIPLKPRKAGKWADEGSKSARKNSTNLIEQERFHDTRKEDSDDDIPVIPDIDDISDDVLALHEVKAPMVSVNKATYKELDTELVNIQQHDQKIANLGNINLSFLTSRLRPEKELKETDEQWTMESLFDNLININK